MSRILKFLRLPYAQRWLLLKGAALLAAIRLLLWALPYPTVRPWLVLAGRTSSRLVGGADLPERLAWAVAAVGDLVPGGGHCLSQALTLEIFMLRRGYSCMLCFGVQRGASRSLSAHAWLEHEGKVLIGGENLHRLVRLTSPADSAP